MHQHRLAPGLTVTSAHALRDCNAVGAQMGTRRLIDGLQVAIARPEMRVRGILLGHLDALLGSSQCFR
jgi:hypothetical protein